jgi:hypothetical protein
MNACLRVWGRSACRARPGGPPGARCARRHGGRAAARSGRQDGARNAFAYGQVERPGRARGEGHGDHLAPFAQDRAGAMAAFKAERLDVGTYGLGDRSPFRAGREMRACSTDAPRPAATSKAPTSLRSRPTAWDS